MRRIEKRGEVNVLCDDYGCSPATKAEAEFFDEITRLRAEVEALKLQRTAAELVHRETATTVLMQMAEVQRLRDALKPFAAIDLTTNQAVDPMDVLRARRALEGK